MFLGILLQQEYQEMFELCESGKSRKATKDFLMLLPTKGFKAFYWFCEDLKLKGIHWLCDELCKLDPSLPATCV